MNAEVYLPGDPAPEDVRALYKWLSDEESLTGRVKLAVTPTTPGHLGSATDIISVALGSGIAGALARSLNTWVKMRRSDMKIVVRRNGHTIQVTASNVDDVEATLRQVLDAEDR